MTKTTSRSRSDTHCQHYSLPRETAHVHGRWSPEYVPFWVEPMRWWSSGSLRQLNAAACTQAGKTQFANIAVGYAADVGIYVRNVYRKLRIGAAGRNLGSISAAYVAVTDPMPAEVAVGAAYPFFDRRLLVASDYVWSIDRGNQFNVGGELELVYDFFLRAGYRTRLGDLRDGEDAGLAGFSFGLGFRKIRAYQFDYAIASMGDLGGTHRLSFSWVFR